MTRAFCAVGHGDFASAWRLNPWSLPLYGVALVVLALPLLQRARPEHVARALGSRFVTRSPVGLLLVMWAWGIARMLGYWPWPS